MVPDPPRVNYSITPLRRGWAHFAFTDVVSGRPVFYWLDRRGRRWMAEYKWSLFRCRVLTQEEEDWKRAEEVAAAEQGLT